MDSKTEKQEESKKRLIKLVEPTDKILFHENDNQYETPEKIFPHVGRLSLYGHKYNTEFPVSADDRVVLLRDGKLIKGFAKEFEPNIRNMYSLDLRCNSSRVPVNFKCHMRVNNMFQLETNLEPMENTANNDPGVLSNRHYTYADKWIFEGEQVTLFLEPDTENLSQTEFAFYTDHSVSQIAVDTYHF